VWNLWEGWKSLVAEFQWRMAGVARTAHRAHYSKKKKEKVNT
jgi:hypothetical protein